MKYQELIDRIAEAQRVPTNTVRRILDQAAVTMLGALAEGQDIRLPQLGKFKIKVREAYTGRNPLTNAPVNVAAKKNIKFTAASSASAKLNQQ